MREKFKKKLGKKTKRKHLKILDKIVKWGYCKFNYLPYYLSIGKYCFCIYSVDLDWAALRIKIEHGNKVWRVLKKGKF
jgi:hypothetical protein